MLQFTACLKSLSTRLPPLSLFWRSFSLLLILLFASFALWTQGMAVRQEHPRAQTVAWQLVTAVNLTRSALVHAKVAERGALLKQINQDERVGVFVREGFDAVIPLKPERFNDLLQASVQERLGAGTVLASSVNQQAGLWISFDMGGSNLGVNSYWLKVDPKRLETRAQNPTRWWLWSAFSLFIAGLGAAWITRRLTKPLSDLAQRTHALAQAKPYEVLPDSPVREIAQVNAGMNTMAQSLAAQDQERRVMLAGLSHDLRTPLARLRLEIELAKLQPDQHSAMLSDIAQIDQQLKQFTDFIATQAVALVPLELSALVVDRALRYCQDPRGEIKINVTPDLSVLGDKAQLIRLIDNVLENALRYGGTGDAEAGVANITLSLSKVAESVVFECADTGPGIAAQRVDEIQQAFVRGDAARSGADGSGLGLAIVKKIAQQHHAELEIVSDVGAGFRVLVRFEAVK